MYKEKMLRLGLIGLGDHMYRRLYPLTVGLPVHLPAVCDRNEERCRRFTEKFSAERVYTDLEEMLDREELNGVLCAGNAGLHYRAAKACMERGISPFVEKTPCETYAQAVELRELEKASGCFTMVGFNRRFTTSYQMAKEIVERREFGEKMLYMAKYHSSVYPSDEYFLLNHVIHHLDLARYLMGEIREIHGEKVVRGVGKAGYHIRFVTESGALGFLETSSFQREDYPMERVEITGDGCNVIVDNVKGLEYNRPVSDKRGLSPVLEPGLDLQGWNYNQGHSSLYGHYGFERELEYYVDGVRGLVSPAATFGDTAETMKLYEELRDHCVPVDSRGGYEDGGCI